MAVTKRLNWLKWLYPGEAGLQSDQDWHMDKRRAHMMGDHLSGVTSGLEVIESGTPDLEVHVQTGRAIDGDGEEVVLLSVVDVDLSSFAAAGATVLIVAEYDETGTDPYIVPETAVSQDKFLQDTPTITAITGAPAANQIVLAQVVVSNGATQITDAVDPENPGTDEIDMTVVVYSTLSRSASEKIEGVVELATIAEAQAGTDDTRAVTPKKLHEGVPLPLNYIAGLITANDLSDISHDINVGLGVARDDTDVANLRLAAAITKQIDAVWAVGTNQGGLDTGAAAASTIYAMWLIKRSDTGVVDVLFSASFTSPTMPTDYDRKRLIAAVRTDGSADILPYVQAGDVFAWAKDAGHDVSDTSITHQVFETGTLIAPPNCLATVQCLIHDAGTVDRELIVVLRPIGSIQTAIRNNAFIDIQVGAGHTVEDLGGIGTILIDGSSQFQYASFESGAQAITLQIRTISFIMLTRRDP